MATSSSTAKLEVNTLMLTSANCLETPPHWFAPPPPAEEWLQANPELVERNQYKVKELPVGEKMLFRVVAINIAGRSPPATLPQAVTIREIMGQRRHLATFTAVWEQTFTSAVPHRASEDPPSSPSENQAGGGGGREDQPGHPLPG